MMKILLSVGLGWTVLSAQAQLKEPWSKGTIILADGEHLNGDILFAPDVEVVSVKMENGTLKAYNSRQIISFCFQDTVRKTQRNFKISVLPDSGREAIVEVVFEGTLEVLRCLRYRKKNLIRPLFNYFPDDAVQHSAFRYYVHDGLHLCTLEYFLKKSFKSKTARWRNQLELFKTRNDLNNGTESWLRVLLFYNDLEKERLLRQPQINQGDDVMDLVTL